MEYLFNSEWLLKNKRPTWCHLLFYFTSYVLNMFRTLIYPSSGACDCAIELPHRSFCSWFDVCWRFGVVGFGVVSVLQAEAQLVVPQPLTKNKTTDVVIQHHSRKLLMMDILMSETCWAHKKWNKIASDIKLIFHSSTSIHVGVIYEMDITANILCICWTKDFFPVS